MPRLSTHVLDTAQGKPAAGMKIELWELADGARRHLKTVRTNADGRTDQPLLSPAEMKCGQFELVFFVGEYFSGNITGIATPPFLDHVPVRFGIADMTAS